MKTLPFHIFSVRTPYPFSNCAVIGDSFLYLTSIQNKQIYQFFNLPEQKLSPVIIHVKEFVMTIQKLYGLVGIRFSKIFIHWDTMKWTIYDTIIYLKIEKSLPILAASLCVRSDSRVSSTSHLWRTLYRVHLSVVEVCIWYTSPLANFVSSTPQRCRSLYRTHLTPGGNRP